MKELCAIQSGAQEFNEALQAKSGFMIKTIDWWHAGREPRPLAALSLPSAKHRRDCCYVGKCTDGPPVKIVQVNQLELRKAK